jgi:hypothetical protein
MVIVIDNIFLQNSINAKILLLVKFRYPNALKNTKRKTLIALTGTTTSVPAYRTFTFTCTSWLSE